MSVQEGSPGDPIPGDKSRKYDRQLRLWGDHGQSAIECAKVCLINATATGTEIMKNVILPGAGSFTIVDSKRVTEEDAGNNFFLEYESVGKSRAQVTTEFLQELNEDANGDYLDETVENLLSNNPDFFNNFSIVVATDVAEDVLLRLSNHLWENNVPLLVCRSYGMVGYIRLVVKEHTVIESHPDSLHEDLRLDRPFPEFVQYCDSLELDAMNSKDHSHTPWLVILYKYLQKWKYQHGEEIPRNYMEKNLLKEMLHSGIRRNEDGVPVIEENFDETIRNLNASLVPTKIPKVVADLFNDDSCLNITSESKPFWILTRAVKEFVKREGKGALPLRGSIPDMTADSARYIELQNIYKKQAIADVEIVSGYVQNILNAIGRDEPLACHRLSPGSSPIKPQENITEKDIQIFCKNASTLHVLRSRSLQEEYNTAKSADIGMHLESADDDDDTVLYIMLRAVDRFFLQYKRYPGYDMDTMESDMPKLKSCLSKLLQEYGISQTVKDEYVHEFCRYGAAELHSVAAFIGGAASQEIIKIVTGQFIPINNTYIYNAMKQTSVTLNL